jgi:ATP-dependent helicase HrpB
LIAWIHGNQRTTTDLTLPVVEVLPQLQQALARDGRAVLQAPPGAGKTTLVPPALLGAPWLGDNRIVMLEPRRVAARAAAHRMAELLGESVGATVGFRTRTESRVSHATRIEVVTEGILTRRLQRDPTLEGVGLVIFDEFHERSLIADLGLALTLHSRRLVRGDLRLLVMSATLDSASVARLLEDAPIVTAEGRVFPVDTRYVPPRDPRALDAAIVGAIRRALANDPGDGLVFLPGAAEINRIRGLLTPDAGDVDVLSLHGSLGAAEQDRAVRPGDRRRVVLATSIAETSLTIPGVRIVIDAGLARRPRFAPATGMTRLETLRVSRATADQRRGRAGRTASGVCYRLWHEHEELVPAPAPEILETDLGPLALDLAAAGIGDPSELSWIDLPPPGAFAAARELLRELDLLDEAGKITHAGRRAAAMPVHPRLAHMLLQAQSSTARRVAANLAALLNERDFIRFDGRDKDPDVRLRLEVLEGASRGAGMALPAGAMVVREVVERVARDAKRLLTDAGESGKTEGEGHVGAGELLAFAYPDRVAMRRVGQRGRYVTRDGVEVVIDAATLLANETFIVAAELDGRRPLSKVWLAAPIDASAVERLFGGAMQTVRTVAWIQESQSVAAVEQRRLGAIVLSERTVRADPADVAAALLQALLERGFLERGDVKAELARLAFANSIESRESFAKMSLDGARTASDWLLPALIGLRSLAEAERLDLAEAILGRLDYRDRKRLDEIAPTHITVPTGSRIRVDYANAAGPSAAVRIQELFGLIDTPRVGLGRVPVALHLLSPAHRPVQVTRDLAGFWKNSYFDVRKELRGRYPRHPWPDDPASATPTRRAKPRGS